MSSALVEIVSREIAPEVERLRGLSSQELFQIARPAIEALLGEESLPSGTEDERAGSWIKKSFRAATQAPVTLAKGAWDAMKDPEARHQTERVAHVVAFLMTMFGQTEKLPLGVLVAAAMFLISLGTSPERHK